MQVNDDATTAHGRQLLGSLAAGLLTGAAAFAASAPALVVELSAGLMVFGVFALAVGLLAWFRKLPFGHWPAYPIGLAAAASLLAPMVLNADIRSFLEAGFDDGPFHGRPFHGDIGSLQPSHRIVFRSGELIVFNRADDEPPVLAYVVEDAGRWALELDGTADPDFNWTEFSRVSEPLTVSLGILRDRLDFVAHWTFGAERGTVYIWRFGGVQRFYLSW